MHARNAARRPVLRDPLTGLPGPELALDRVEHLTAHLHRVREAIGLVAIRLGGLDVPIELPPGSTGSEGGTSTLDDDDRVLAITAALHLALRPTDTLARMGDAELLAICPRLEDGAAVGAIAERLRNEVLRTLPDVVVGGCVSITTGTAVVDRPDREPAAAIGSARAAADLAAWVDDGHLGTAPDRPVRRAVSA